MTTAPITGPGAPAETHRPRNHHGRLGRHHCSFRSASLASIRRPRAAAARQHARASAPPASASTLLLDDSTFLEIAAATRFRRRRQDRPSGVVTGFNRRRQVAPRTSPSRRRLGTIRGTRSSASWTTPCAYASPSSDSSTPAALGPGRDGSPAPNTGASSTTCAASGLVPQMASSWGPVPAAPERPISGRWVVRAGRVSPGTGMLATLCTHPPPPSLRWRSVIWA